MGSLSVPGISMKAILFLIELLAGNSRQGQSWPRVVWEKPGKAWWSSEAWVGLWDSVGYSRRGKVFLVVEMVGFILGFSLYPAWSFDLEQMLIKSW